MPNLSDLYLDQLQCSADPILHTSQVEGFDEDLALKAVWKTRQEVEVGVRHLVASYALYQVNVMTPQGSMLFPEHIRGKRAPKYYLNLRWANLKAALQISH